MKFELVLQTITDLLEREEIRYTLVGGLAIHAWGRMRPTKDADFAVRLEDQERTIRIAESLGYETTYVSRAFSNHEHGDPAWGHVDFMYLAGETALRVMDASTPKEVLPGKLIPVASPEHLAMMKALAMKNFPRRALYEGEDVRTLLSVPGVDRESIRDYFGKLGLLDLYDAIEKAR